MHSKRGENKKILYSKISKYFLDDFGLSISGYPNQSNSNLVNNSSKQQQQQQPVNTDYQPVVPLNPYEEFNERKIKPNTNSIYGNQRILSPSEYPNMYPDEYSSVTTLPSIDNNNNKPKFEPTKATQYIN